MNYIDELEREKAHSDTMKAAAQMWMNRTQEAQRQIIALVHGAGGQIKVAPDTLYELPHLTLEIYRDFANNLVVFQTRHSRRKKGQAA